MPDINDILRISSGDDFIRSALELFSYQYSNCAAYREYVDLLGIDPSDVTQVNKIPFMPVEIFKIRDVYDRRKDPDKVFTSSTTGGGEPSRHFMASLEDYKSVFKACFESFYGKADTYSIYALLPSYLEREGSSLVYMVRGLIGKDQSRGGFYLYDQEKLLEDMADNPGPKILLGVTYALLDLAENYSPDLKGTIVMETGGMKGRRNEISKPELHNILCSSFGVDRIHSEYGMAELTSQAYSAGSGIFRTVPWMKVLVRDPNDPFDILPHGSRGGVNIIDLANIHSCAFIQTDDIGRTHGDDSFEILGRLDRSDIRGCNLLV